MYHRAILRVHPVHLMPRIHYLRRYISTLSYDFYESFHESYCSLTKKKSQVFLPSTISLLGRYDFIFFFNLFPFITPPLSFSTIVQHSSAPFHRRVSAFLPIVLRCQISPGHGSRVVTVLRTPDAHPHPRHNEGVGFYSNAPLSDTSSTTQTSSIVRFRNRTKSGNSVFLRERRRLVAIIDSTFFSRRGIELAELANSVFFLS